jgi:hypothetical protein
VHALSAIFRAKFRDAMHAQGLLTEIPAAVWEIDWNVNCQAVGSGEATLKYLARYVFKVAISDPRIVRFDDTEVVFRYRKVHSNRVRTMALPVFAFMHRFLQHVLPSGFMKVRYYGFVSPSFAMPLAELKARVELAQGFALQPAPAQIESRPPLCCRFCGGRLRYRVHRHTRALADRPDLTTDDAFASSCLAPVLPRCRAHRMGALSVPLARARPPGLLLSGVRERLQ